MTFSEKSFRLNRLRFTAMFSRLFSPRLRINSNAHLDCRAATR
jgi:hypothetical protein